MQLALKSLDLGENPKFLEKDLITYIGNKRGLLPFIGQGVEIVKTKLKKDRLDFLDLFAGSGVVSRLMKQHAESILCNDIEAYTKIVNACYLANKSELNLAGFKHWHEWLKNEIATDWRPGFIAELYAPKDDADIKPGERVFYTRRNAEYIDTARQHIANMPADWQPFFLAPLIVKASIHNNTGGVFKGFYKNRKGVGAFGGEAANALSRIKADIEIGLPVFSEYDCAVEVSQKDALDAKFFKKRHFDLVYLDPPYNQHPYGSNYFMLNLIANYERPNAVSKVSGIPEDWTRSPFNKPQSAKKALFSIIENIDAKHFLISYNSEGFIKKDEFTSGLQDMGTLTSLETSYNTYRGSRNLSGRDIYVTEYLFLLEKKR